MSFTKRVKTGVDDFNNPVYSSETLSIDDCLIGPPTEPYDRVETSALDRDITLVRVHLPQGNTVDVSDSEFMYDGQTFRVIGKPVKFMEENTPTRWSSYLRAEAVHG